MNRYAPKNLNKEEAQQLYDSGLSLRDLKKYYGVALQTIVRLGLETRSKIEGNKLKERTFSEEGLKKLSDSAKARGLGGYRPHPNKGKRYKEIWFDSEWEVKVAESLDHHNVKWIRPKVGFVWNDAGNKYYPDFYLPEYDVYLDPKNNYLQTIDGDKIKNAEIRNNIRVIVLSKHQLDWKSIALIV